MLRIPGLLGRTMPARALPAEDPLAWWARGDAPVRLGRPTVALIDGRAALLAMAVAFLTARRSIWLADWSLFAALRMVRGRDVRAGDEGSEPQEELLRRLRAAGLDTSALRLWQQGRLAVRDVLGFAASRDVRVRVLLWNPFNPFGLMHLIQDPHDQRRQLDAVGVECRLDASSRSPFHVAQSLHQKCAVVDGRVAFAGGVDPDVERHGDYDRWDVPAHPHTWPLRGTALGPSPHPWHDAHLLISGTAAQDVEYNIRQRWDEAPASFFHVVTPPLRHLARRVIRGQAQPHFNALCLEEPAAPTSAPDGAGDPPADARSNLPGDLPRMQVVRTIPPLTYRFAPEGVDGIAQVYLKAIRQARRFIYLESQYFWLENFNGIDRWRLGWQSTDMRELVIELGNALERGVEVALVLPDHPNAGRHYTGDTLGWLRARAPQAADARLHVFTLGATTPADARGPTRYRPIYVHAKVGIVDDRWATVGSANLNSRGMAHDAELNVAVMDRDFARALRLELWAEHLGARHTAVTGWPQPAALPQPGALRSTESSALAALLCATPAPGAVPADGDADGAWPPGAPSADELDDPRAGLRALGAHAAANLERMRRGEPLVGQLLPYLRRADATRLGLPITRERGVLDMLSGEPEGAWHARHGRYI